MVVVKNTANKMTNWQRVRIGLLTVTLIAVLFILGKLTFYPPVDNFTFTPFQFPKTVPLSTWEQIDSVPLKSKDYPDVLTSWQYKYQKNLDANSWKLDIDMRYLVNTDGKVEKWMQEIAGMKFSAAKLSYGNQAGVGSYGLLEYQERAYLSSCINPRGLSTFELDQFRQNRNLYDLQFSRILAWILGRESLKDNRCLWSQLSLPLEKTDLNKAYKILAAVWSDWYQWWQPRFPPS